MASLGARNRPMNARQLGIFALDGLALGAALLLAAPFFFVMIAPFVAAQ